MTTKKWVINRRRYKELKKFDHDQMNDFLAGIYCNAYEDGMNDAIKHATINYDVLMEVLASVKGIGAVRARQVVQKLQEREM